MAILALLGFLIILAEVRFRLRCLTSIQSVSIEKTDK